MARADELIRLLYLSETSFDGNPDRDHINGLEHSLRVATLARRWAKGIHWFPDNAEQQIRETSFMGLVHDLGRPLSDPFHGEVIAEIVRDMVPDDIYHTLRVHGTYQSQYIHGTSVDTNAQWHALSKALCAWEVASFAVNWPHETMTRKEAVTLIYQVCAGRD